MPQSHAFSRSAQAGLPLFAVLVALTAIPATLVADVDNVDDVPLAPAHARRAIEVGERLDAAAPGRSIIVPRGRPRVEGYQVVDGLAMIEGDIVLGRVDSRGRVMPRITRRGLAIEGSDKRWPAGILPYVIDDGVAAPAAERVRLALREWQTRTRIVPLERTAENAARYPDYVVFEGAAGCASFVGRIGDAQTIWVASHCPVGSIVHEIGHALGLYHEHTRPDRDAYVTVNWDNIEFGRDFNFSIVSNDRVLSGEYDYGSIMHYGSHFFSKNGRPTLEVPFGVSIGQREALSDTDIASIDAIYATDLGLSIDARQAGVTADGNTRIRLDVHVSNLGPLEAGDLLLTADLDDEARWASMDEATAWECRADGTRLECTVDRMAAGLASRLTLEAITNAGIPRIDAQVSARTLDLDVRNDRVVIEAIDGDSRRDVPDRPAAATPPADDGGAGSVAGLGICLLSLRLGIGARRRRKRTGGR